MSRTVFNKRPPWEDRFRQPTATELLSELTKQHAGMLGGARTKLSALDGVRETVEWVGIPWRWSFVYRTSDGDEVVAYLVPQPAKPMVCVPMPGELVSQMPLKKMSRFIRDAIMFSARVGDVHWCQWEPAVKAHVDEIIELALHKHGQRVTSA